MPRHREQIAFAPFGNDVKEARKAMGISRRELAEMINIDPRYLANIENSGNLPSLPIFYEIIVICKIPVERYFYPDAAGTRDDTGRERANLKLRLCPDIYLPIVEGTMDAAIKLNGAKYESEAGDE
jgi:transcriptional regulator with XRE-family HTH domain